VVPRPGGASPNSLVRASPTSSARRWVAATARHHLAHLLGATAGWPPQAGSALPTSSARWRGGHRKQAAPRLPPRRVGGWPPRPGSTSSTSSARRLVATMARQRLTHFLGATAGGRHGQAVPRRPRWWCWQLYLVVLGHVHVCLGCLQILFGLFFLISLCLISDT
jgi:hypothetical protein